MTGNGGIFILPYVLDDSAGWRWTMPPIDETPSFEPAPPTSGARKTKGGSTEQPPTSGLISVTLDPATGSIVSVESMDAAGERRELSEEEKSRLSKAANGATLQDLVERAFEAGIGCILGDSAGEDEPPEPDDDAELSRMVLQSLIKRSAVERLMQREILGRAIVGTLIAHAAEPESAATH